MRHTDGVKSTSDHVSGLNQDASFYCENTDLTFLSKNRLGVLISFFVFSPQITNMYVEE